MALSRRTFLKGLAATVAGAIVLPPTLEDNAEAAKRFWALDSTMVGPRHDADSHVVTATEYHSIFAQWVEAYEPRDTPIIDWALSDPSYDAVTIEVGQSYIPLRREDWNTPFAEPLSVMRLGPDHITIVRRS